MYVQSYTVCFGPTSSPPACLPTCLPAQQQHIVGPPIPHPTHPGIMTLLACVFLPTLSRTYMQQTCGLHACGRPPGRANVSWQQVDPNTSLTLVVSGVVVAQRVACCQTNRHRVAVGCVFEQLAAALRHYSASTHRGPKQRAQRLCLAGLVLRRAGTKLGSLDMPGQGW